MMEKGGEKGGLDTSDTDSMTTVNVNVKEYGNPMDYQEPPPAYVHTQLSTRVQITRIIALAAVLITAMLSIAIVFSAWISATSCQQQLQGHAQQSAHSIPVLEALLQPEYLKGFLGASPTPATGNGDLDQAETKDKTKEPVKSSNLVKDVSEEENTSGEGGDEDEGAVTMIKLPLELNLGDHIFERNVRSHMNCIIEKKKAEEIVDEASKPIRISSLNLTSDPRYLHFSGEKMAISCDSGKDHRAMPQPQQPLPPVPSNIFTSQRSQRPISPFLREMISNALSALGGRSSSPLPVHIIGPISFSQGHAQGQETGPVEFLRTSPPQYFNQIVEQESRPQPQPHMMQYQRQPSANHQIFVRPQHQQEEGPENRRHSFGPLSALGIPPHLLPILFPQRAGSSLELDAEPDSSQNPSGPGPIFFHPHSLQGAQSSEISEREMRALPHPVPIMPRAQHGPFVIRPRRSVEDKKSVQDTTGNDHKRVKRCSCDCACKNHQV